MDSKLASVTAHVTGHVQGVGYRAWAKTQAEDLGLSGWVANEDDGSVRAVFTGPGRAVEAIADLLRGGPPGAKVGNVVIEPSDPDFSHTGFRIIG